MKFLLATRQVHFFFLKRVYFICILISIAAISCFGDKDDSGGRQVDSAGVVTRLDPQWMWTGNDAGIQATGIGELKPNAAFNDIVLTNSFTADGHPSITALSLSSGQDLWTWTEFNTDRVDRITVRGFTTYENAVYFPDGANWYGIDLADGSTRASKRLEAASIGQFSALGNRYFTTAGPVDTLSEFFTTLVFQGTLSPLTIEEYLVPSFTYDTTDLFGNRIGGTTWLDAYVENGDTMLLVSWADYRRFDLTNARHEFEPHLGLYNVSEKQWVYEKVVLDEPSEDKTGLRHPLQRYGDRVILNTGRTLQVRDLATGAKVWSQDVPNDIWVSGFTLVDNVVVLNTEGWISYGFDFDTGAKLWTNEGAQLATPLKDNDLNGIIYFVGKYVYAIEVATGKLVWRLDANLAPNPADFYTAELSVAPGKDGEKGKVVVKTGRTVYCYEAYR